MSLPTDIFLNINCFLALSKYLLIVVGKGSISDTILKDVPFNDTGSNITIGVTILEEILFNKDFIVIGFPSNDLV